MGSLNSDQHRTGSTAPQNPYNGAECLPTQACNRIVSNIGNRERQMSASGSPSVAVARLGADLQAGAGRLWRPG